MVAGLIDGMIDFAQNARLTTAALRDLFDATPLQRNDHLSARYGAEIYLKREDLTPVRSYKLRGAFNAMRKVRVARPIRGISSVPVREITRRAWPILCRHFGVKGTIFMPITTPQQKIDKTRTFGGSAIEIVLTGDYFDQTLAASQAYCTAWGRIFCRL